MATETIRIIIQVDGDRSVKRKLKGVGDQAKRSQRSVNLLKGALLGLGAGAIVRGIINVADSYRFIQNRLRVVTRSTAELSAVQARLFEVTRKTRAQFEGTAEIYSRLAIASQDLGVSQNEVINVTEDLNKIVRISGTRVKEASNAMIQLSQGIASNTLRGDELRAVLEQLPLLARFIAREMGVTFGEVRDLAAQGKVTADVIFKALRASRNEIDQRFAKVLPTVSESVLQIRNAFVRWVGEMDNATGASAALARLLLGVADNFDTLAKAATGAAVALGVFAGAKGIGQAIKGLKALWLVLAANPILAVVALIAGVITVLFQFRDSIKVTSDGLVTLGDVWRHMWEGAKSLVLTVWNAVKTFFSNFNEETLASMGIWGQLIVVVIKAIRAIGNFFKGIFTDLEETDKQVAKVIDDIINFFIALFKAVKAGFAALWKDVVNTMQRIWAQAINGLAEKFESFLNFFVDATNKISPFEDIEAVAFGRLDVVAENEGKSFADAWADAWREQMENRFNGLQQFTEEQWKQIREAAEQRVRAAGGAGVDLNLGIEGGGNIPPGGGDEKKKLTFEDVINGLNREYELLQLGNREREIATDLDKILADLEGVKIPEGGEKQIRQLLERNQLREEENQLVEEIKGPMDDLIFRQELLNNLLEQGRITTEEWLFQMREVNAELAVLQGDNFFDFIVAGLKRVIESANNLGQVISDWVVGAFEELTNTVVRFAETGKFEIGQFANVVVAQLLRIATQMLILKALGLIPGLGPAATVASGAGTVVPGVAGGNYGEAQYGGTFKVGGQGGPDSQLLMLRASPNERVTVETPHQQRQSDRMTEQSPVNVKVVNVTDPEAMIGAMESDAGEQTILNTIERNPNTVRSILGG